MRSQADSIKIHLRKKYYITKKYSVKYFLENASYSLENEFSRWIDSFGEDSSIIVALRSIPAQTGSRKLKAMRAERASEIRVNKSVDARNEKIRSEIPELDRMLKSTGLNGNSLFDLSLTVKISSSHPASLQRSVNKFLMSMDLLGLKFRAPERVNCKKCCRHDNERDLCNYKIRRGEHKVVYCKVSRGSAYN